MAMRSQFEQERQQMVRQHQETMVSVEVDMQGHLRALEEEWAQERGMLASHMDLLHGAERESSG